MLIARQARDKLNWAAHHLYLLDLEVRKSIAAGYAPFSYGIDPDDNLPGFRVRVREVIPAPVEWSLVVGDFCVNARAALDYLAWLLVSCGSEPNPAYPNKVQFPISDPGDTRQKFDSLLGEALPGIKKREIVSVIRQVQPYVSQLPQGKIHTLGFLKRLSNANKHRELTTFATYAVGDFSLRVVETTDFVVLDTEEGVNLVDCVRFGFKGDAELLIVRGETTGPNPNIGVEMKGQALLAVENEGASVAELESIGEVIGWIIGNVERLLP